MKTVCHWLALPELQFWAVIDGDKRHLNNHFLSSNSPDEIKDEIVSIFYDDSFSFRGNLVITTQEAETLLNNGAFLITCGIL